MQQVRQKKQLMSQLNNLRTEAKVLQTEIANKQREYTTKIKIIKSLQEEINKLDTDNTLKVSEHAIIRYFERVLGLDISQVEKQIISEKIIQMVKELGGNGTYPNKGPKDFQVVIKDYTVTTII